MKITRIETIPIRLPARRVHQWASLTTPIGVYVIVKLTTDEGLVGLGEAPVLKDWGGDHMKYYGETPQTTIHIVNDILAPALSGKDPGEIEALHLVMDRAIKGYPYCKAALDMALYDVVGKALDIPAYDLLGGRCRERVTIAHSIGLMEIDKAVEEALQVKDEGVKAIKLKGQIKRATIYPTAIIIVAVVVISALLIFVIPTFAKMFADLSGGKTGLPWPTELVINISNFMQNYWYIIFGGMYGLLRVFKWYYGTPKGNVQIDALALKLPLMGDLIRKASVARFSRTLGTLIASGVPILEGLIIVAKTSGNKVVEQAIMSARSSISEGKTVAEPLAKSGVFPSMVTQMIAVGEATGALDAMLAKIADFYDDEVDAAVEALTAAMEPAIMMILGPIIGFVVIAMYLPIFEMASAMG